MKKCLFYDPRSAATSSLNKAGTSQHRTKHKPSQKRTSKTQPSILDNTNLETHTTARHRSMSSWDQLPHLPLNRATAGASLQSNTCTAPNPSVRTHSVSLSWSQTITEVVSNRELRLELLRDTHVCHHRVGFGGGLIQVSRDLLPPSELQL